MEATVAERGQITLPKAVRDALGCYVRLLEAHCREMPPNWFNFFDFWAAPAQASAPSPDTAAA